MRSFIARFIVTFRDDIAFPAFSGQFSRLRGTVFPNAARAAFAFRFLPDFLIQSGGFPQRLGHFFGGDRSRQARQDP